MKTALTAFALATGLLAAPAIAQDANMTMDVGLSMLELAAHKELSQYGFGDFDVMDLSLNQLAKIRYVAGASDYSENDRKQQIKQIIGAN